MEWMSGVGRVGPLAVCLGLTLAGVGCGGESKEQHGNAGSAGTGTGATGTGGTGTGGTGTGGSGGSDTAQRTPPAMGVSLTLTRPSDPNLPKAGSRTCFAGTTGGFTYAIGAPTPGKTISDGTNGTTVSCTVAGTGSSVPFVLQGSGTDANGGKLVSFSFNGSVQDKGDPSQNPGGMAFFSPDTGQLVTLDGYPACTFGPVGTLKSGAILTEVDCPLLGAADDTAGGCAVHGTIAFEYCSTGAEGP
jgi:hypothetical protein